MKTFKERFLAGQATEEDIDQEVDNWHAGKSNKSLASYLGLTPREYSNFVAHPNIFWSNLKELKASGKR